MDRRETDSLCHPMSVRAGRYHRLWTSRVSIPADRMNPLPPTTTSERTLASCKLLRYVSEELALGGPVEHVDNSFRAGTLRETGYNPRQASPTACVSIGVAEARIK